MKTGNDVDKSNTFPFEDSANVCENVTTSSLVTDKRLAVELNDIVHFHPNGRWWRRNVFTDRFSISDITYLRGCVYDNLLYLSRRRDVPLFTYILESLVKNATLDPSIEIVKCDNISAPEDTLSGFILLTFFLWEPVYW